jgi:DNA invertase Pin-like site-specific DNA recombinase
MIVITGGYAMGRAKISTPENAQKTPALAYLRVSSRGQVDGDGLPRQREAIRRYADAHGLDLIGEYADEGVSGAEPDRPALSDMLARVQEDGIGVVLVERADRWARDLVVGELLLREARSLGARVVEVEGGHDLTDDDAANPTQTLIRQVLGAVAQFEKAGLVAKLRAARRRVRRERGRCEGAKPYGERPGEAEAMARIVRLRRRTRAGQRTWAEIAAVLAEEGHPTRSGRPWTGPMVRELVLGARRRQEAAGAWARRER